MVSPLRPRRGHGIFVTPSPAACGLAARGYRFASNFQQEYFTMSIRVTVWGEFRHEKTNAKVSAIYPKGMHEAIADGLRKSSELQVRTAWLDQPEAGLTDEILAATDVLTWWGHRAHGDVPDAVVERVYNRVVVNGMGLIVLHSGHFSKIFKKLMGASCDLKWREEENEREVLWVTRPGHPILAGIDDHFVIERAEMYGEFFDIP